MALTNRQYSDIEREYESRRMRHIRQMQAKLDEAYHLTDEILYARQVE